MMDRDQIAAAVAALEMRPRLEGINQLLLIDLVFPDGAAGATPAMAAARGMHRGIEADDALSDIEETLEDALKSGDARAIDEGCELYRALLIDRLLTVLDGPEGQDRLRALAAEGLKA